MKEIKAKENEPSENESIDESIIEDIESEDDISVKEQE